MSTIYKYISMYSIYVIIYILIFGFGYLAGYERGANDIKNKYNNIIIKELQNTINEQNGIINEQNNKIDFLNKIQADRQKLKEKYIYKDKIVMKEVKTTSTCKGLINESYINIVNERIEYAYYSISTYISSWLCNSAKLCASKS